MPHGLLLNILMQTLTRSPADLEVNFGEYCKLFSLQSRVFYFPLPTVFHVFHRMLFYPSASLDTELRTDAFMASQSCMRLR